MQRVSGSSRGEWGCYCGAPSPLPHAIPFQGSADEEECLLSLFSFFFLSPLGGGATPTPYPLVMLQRVRNIVDGTERCCCWRGGARTEVGPNNQMSVDEQAARMPQGMQPCEVSNPVDDDGGGCPHSTCVVFCLLSSALPLIPWSSPCGHPLRRVCVSQASSSGGFCRPPTTMACCLPFDWLGAVPCLAMV
jgi:hypothetical protein